MKKRVVILGSTGSIGTSALKVARDIPERMEVVALAAHSNVVKLAEQAREFKVQHVCIYDSSKVAELQRLLPSGVQVYAGLEGLCQLATLDCADMVRVSIIGTDGLKPTLEAIEAGKDLARCHAEVQAKHTRELEDIRTFCTGLFKDEVMDFLTDDEKARAEKYIMSLPDDDSVLHLDFHTGNVLVDKDGNCRVIDWMTAARGNRAVEYALMEFLFSEAELFPEASEAQRKFMGLIRGSIGKQFYKEYNRLTPISEVAVDRYRLLALILRRSWNIKFEEPYLTRKIRDLIALYCK